MTEPCQLCGGTHFETVSERDRHGKPLKTVICMGCGVITNDPIPSDEELAAFYTSDYRKEYKGAAEPRMRQVWRNFERIERHYVRNHDIYKGRKKLLDLGSGSGEFMFIASKAGIDSLGVEPNQDYSAYTRDKLGLNVMTQTLEETEFADGAFDLIRLSHVLEHMRDPVRSLKVLRRWLSDDGVLFLIVPNTRNDAAARVHGKLFHYGHIFNHSPYTLRLAARMAGFEELPQSKERFAEATAGFFVKSEKPFVMPEGAAENAREMKAVMDAYNTRTLPQPKDGGPVGRFFSVMGRRLMELVEARKFRTHRDVAEHFASKAIREAGPA